MKVVYNEPIEIYSKELFYFLSNKFAGIIAHRIDEAGRFWIKILYFRKEYRLALEEVLENHNKKPSE